MHTYILYIDAFKHIHTIQHTYKHTTFIHTYIIMMYNCRIPVEVITMASHSSPDTIAALKAAVREILL